MSTDEPDVLTRSARPPDRTVVTGPEQTDVYDVWEPPADRAPRGLTVALVHGGFWREQYDRHHLPPLAAALAADGFHVANLEYPRIGMPGGGWPGTGTSVSDRVESALADDQLPHRLLVVGHSAGGHLALWLASAEQPPAGLAGVVALAPVASLAEAHRLHLSHDAAVELLGGTPDQEPAAWAAADPARLGLTLPAVVLTAANDDEVPGPVIAAYREGREVDEPVTFSEVVGAGHYDLIDPDHAAYLTLLAHLEQLAIGLG